MAGTATPQVLVLGGNLGGLTAARFIREQCQDHVQLTVLDRRDYLVFIPNIPLEVLANHNPARSLRMPLARVLEEDGTRFLQAEVTEIDLDRRVVTYVPSERLGSASERIGYDYLVIALGARLAYDRIEGFGEFGHTLSDTYYGNRLRWHLHEGGYQGGPIAIGSAAFGQGNRGRPQWLPTSKAACDGPPLEIAMALAPWLQERKLGGPQSITLFSPADPIAEDAGPQIVEEFLQLAGQMGFHYQRDTPDVSRITADGIEFSNGTSLEAELKIVFPNWEPHALLKSLPLADEAGFVVTDELMRSTDYPNVFAVGDAAALTVPKLGAHGHKQAEIVARQLAKEVGLTPAEADTPFWPEIICMGDMGGHRAFYIHSDVWYGGKTSVFKMGYLYYALKIGFKEMYFRTGGKPPTWGVPFTEFVAERLAPGQRGPSAPDDARRAA